MEVVFFQHVGEALKARLLGKTRIDVVHLHWLPRVQPGIRGAASAVLFVARVRLLALSGCKIVWTVHNLLPHETVSPKHELRIRRTIARIANKIIVHGPSAVPIVAEAFGVDVRRTVVVAHGNYLESYPNDIGRDAARRRLGLSRSSLVFLFFGQIRPYKGLNRLLAVFRRLDTSSDVTLLVAGQPMDGAMRNELLRCAGSLGRVRLHLEAIAATEVQLYLNAADVVVLPYLRILTSGAVVLAMSFGRPCIAPALGCIPDFVDTDGGFLYDPDDPDGLLSSLQRAIAHREQLSRMGAHNLERVRDWKWSHSAAKTAEVYRDARLGDEGAQR